MKLVLFILSIIACNSLYAMDKASYPDIHNYTQQPAPYAPPYTPIPPYPICTCPTHTELKKDISELKDTVFALKATISEHNETINSLKDTIEIKSHKFFLIEFVTASKPIILTGLSFFFIYKLFHK